MYVCISGAKKCKLSENFKYASSEWSLEYIAQNINSQYNILFDIVNNW